MSTLCSKALSNKANGFLILEPDGLMEWSIKMYQHEVILSLSRDPSSKGYGRYLLAVAPNEWSFMIALHIIFDIIDS